MTTYTAGAPSKWADLDGPVHYVDHGGPADAPVIVLVHGLGGSHANWAPLASLLTSRYRVLAIDLPGFGLTPGTPRPATVTANRRVLDSFLAEVVGEPAVLVGNSMGGLISALQASRAPATVRALVMIDPALAIGATLPDPLVVSTFAAFAVPRSIRRWLARRRPAPTVEQLSLRLLTLVTADPASIPPEVIAQHAALARARLSITGADADLIVAARSLAPWLGNRRRHRALMDSLTMPVLLIHGTKDRLVPIRAAREAAKAHPAWRFEEAEGLGHVPMMEAPEWTAATIKEWLADTQMTA